MTHANPDTPSSPFTSSSAAPARGALGVVDPADLITVAGSLGASHVGLTLLTDTGTVESCWASDDIPVRVDMLQRELDQGPVPCWPAPAHVLVAADLAEDARWPDFAERCISVVGVHSLLCVRIPVASGRLAVLSVYAPQPQAFDDQREKAGQLASLCTDFAEHCDAELAVLSPPPDGAGGGLVATALGVVMARYRVVPAEGFRMLSRSAGDLGISLLAMAREVVRTDRLPAREIVAARVARRVFG
jgi:hypothetical protein